MYINDLLVREIIDQELALRAVRVWNQVFCPGYMTPDVGADSDGGLLFSWNNENYHLEIEFYRDGSIDWFYLEYKTGKMKLTSDLRDRDIKYIRRYIQKHFKRRTYES